MCSKYHSVSVDTNDISLNEYPMYVSPPDSLHSPLKFAFLWTNRLCADQYCCTVVVSIIVGPITKNSASTCLRFAAFIFWGGGWGHIVTRVMYVEDMQKNLVSVASKWNCILEETRRKRVIDHSRRNPQGRPRLLRGWVVLYANVTPPSSSPEPRISHIRASRFTRNSWDVTYRPRSVTDRKYLIMTFPPADWLYTLFHGNPAGYTVV